MVSEYFLTTHPEELLEHDLYSAIPLFCIIYFTRDWLV